MHYFLLIYFNNKPLHVSSRLAAAASYHKPITYTNCCLYRVYPHDDEQQACSKHVRAYY